MALETPRWSIIYTLYVNTCTCMVNRYARVEGENRREELVRDEELTSLSISPQRDVIFFFCKRKRVRNTQL